VWIGYPGLKKSLGNKEAGSVAALPMWIHFMEKFLKDKPNDQFPKAPPPDKEVIAKRGEAERAIRNAQAEEAAAKANDETSDKAKSAAQDDVPLPDVAPKEPTRKPSPKLEEPDGGGPPRTDHAAPRTGRPRPELDRVPPPPPAIKQDDKKKRGKNG
jgi:membrane carboxypeptidase/penicillin-binding protein